MSSFLLALGLIFAAELGDKSQLLVLAFAARFPLKVVVPAVFVATLLIHLASVSVGHAAGAVLPTFWTQLISGLAFLVFGLWSLREDRHKADGAVPARTWGPFLTIAASFFLSELGDKTMLASVAIASREQSFLAVWLGSTLGMFFADAIALLAGYMLGSRLPANTLRYLSAAIFLITGAVVLATLFFRG